MVTVTCCFIGLVFVTITTFVMDTLVGHPVGQKASMTTNIDWWSWGQKELQDSLRINRNTAVAKNVILFIGDGMGMSTVTAARFFLAQKRNRNIHKTLLSWERFPHVALSRSEIANIELSLQTYNSNQQTADSAGTATAILAGVKTRAGTIGVDEHVTRGNCSTMQGHQVKSMLHHSHEAGKWTGVVTTTRVTHATPAASYASAPDRGWESDVDIPEPDREYCKDIARQLVEENSFIRVVMGGGRLLFLPREERDPERNFRGERQDGRNLIKEWYKKQVLKTGWEGAVSLAMNLTQFQEANLTEVEYMLGLFEGSHMHFEADRKDPQYERWGEPSLADMTETAIRVLSKSERGFFLLVEGGRIDHAHHDGNAYRALTDTVALSDAVARAALLTSSSDTLIIVTADHSHTFTMSGYSTLDNDILGLANEIYDGEYVRLSLADDNLPYTTLNYANGPGWYRHRATGSHQNYNPIQGRKNLTLHGTRGITGHKDFRQDALFPVRDETHGGEDVAIYANGPMSHLFHGSHDQSFIAHVMMYAACVGPNVEHCQVEPLPCPDCWTSAASNPYVADIRTLWIILALCRLASFI